MVGGFTPSIEASGKMIASVQANLGIKSRKPQHRCGFGFDFTPFLNSPREYVFPEVLVNMLGDEASVFSAPIKYLNTNTFRYTLFFNSMNVKRIALITGATGRN